LGTLAEAQTLVDKTGDRWREAEGYRLRGELLLQSESRDRSPHTAIRMQKKPRRVFGRRSASPVARRRSR
jgi:hypothetical protein